MCIKGRILDDDFKNYIKETNIINLVKNYNKNYEKNIFLGIRNNQINLYIAGGSALAVTNKKISFDYGYIKNKKTNKYYKYYDDKAKKIEKLINTKSNDINDWTKNFSIISDIVVKYQYADTKEVNTKREKIVQQKICYAFNNNPKSLYYAYDMEYNIEGFKNYVKDIKGNIVKTEANNDKQMTPGRADIMLISKPDSNKKFKIIFMEVKEGTQAFSGVSKKDKTFGSGIVGHMRNYMPVIYDLNKNGMVYTDRLKKNIDLKNHILKEVKNTMEFYKNNGLITNPNFKNIDYQDLNESNVTFELAFYLVGYDETKSTSFKNHLGLNKSRNALYNVKDLIEENKCYKDLGLEYLNIDGIKKIIDFKYISTPLNYKNITMNDINVDIDHYNVISFKEN